MSSAGSQKVRVLIIGYRRFSELINAVMPEFEDEAEVTIVESVASGNTEYHTLVARHAPDVVASAGSNAAYLNATLPVPVISQPVTDTDIVEALAKARRIASDVHLFSYQPEHAPLPRLFNSLPGLLDVEFTHHPYSTSSQAAEMLELAIAEHDPGVIVGPSYTCHMAEQRGLPSILVYSKESARGMLREAIDAGRSQIGHHRGETAPAWLEEFVIRSDSMERLAALADTYARSPGAVLIEGESGTGKEHITKEIHRRSEYSDGPLVAVNCGSIPNELFESELFGYVEGAFTGTRRGGRVGLIEQANGGVLYLDEVGEMPASQQVKLLRVLQEKRIRPVGSNREIPLDFKVVAATNRDLRDAVASGRFRDDLYYRLNVFSLKLPPLRERPDDIAAIARYYLRQYGNQYDVSVDLAAAYASVEDAFNAYSWPGNVRELQNFVERLVVNCAARAGVPLEPVDIERILPELFLPRPRSDAASGSLREQEARAIRTAMLKFNGDRNRVAESLGISTTTLWRRLRSMEQSRPGDAETISSGTQSR
jgi:propionate catabolism operon transcriptional regulator